MNSTAGTTTSDISFIEQYKGARPDTTPIARPTAAKVATVLAVLLAVAAALSFWWPFLSGHPAQEAARVLGAGMRDGESRDANPGWLLIGYATLGLLCLAVWAGAAASLWHGLEKARTLTWGLIVLSVPATLLPLLGHQPLPTVITCAVGLALLPLLAVAVLRTDSRWFDPMRKGQA